MTITRLIAALSVAVMLPFTVSAAPKSIVGQWAPSLDSCDNPSAGAAIIGRMSYTEDQISCTFNSVSRSGNKVTWTGTCDEGDGAKDVTMTATQSNGKLFISLNGNKFKASLMRCSSNP